MLGTMFSIVPALHSGALEAARWLLQLDHSESKGKSEVLSLSVRSFTRRNKAATREKLMIPLYAGFSRGPIRTTSHMRLEIIMIFRDGIACSLLTFLIIATPPLKAHAQTSLSSGLQTDQEAAVQAQGGQSFNGPSFRKGLWRFVRTLDVVRNSNKNVKYRIVSREMTRCVDPTQAMKATFSSASIGSCVSDKPQKMGNKYTFEHRCDYMGAVTTTITVRSDEAYTELNEVSKGEHPKTELVVATRIGDCNDGAGGPEELTVSQVQR
jgi:hypothetical protein